jgi:hypothetical protein
MANEPTPAEAAAQKEQAAQLAEQEAQVQAAQVNRNVPAAADEAETDDGPADRAPRVWLAYNPQSGVQFGHVPTQGSGANGELTPDETQHYLTRAEYEQATKADPPIYQRARKTDLRPNVPYVGDVKEAAGHGES